MRWFMVSWFSSNSKPPQRESFTTELHHERAYFMVAYSVKDIHINLSKRYPEVIIKLFDMTKDTLKGNGSHWWLLFLYVFIANNFYKTKKVIDLSKGPKCTTNLCCNHFKLLIKYNPVSTPQPILCGYPFC